MATAAMSNEVDEGTPNRSIGRIVGGLGLLLPAGFCCISQLLLPTVRTFLLSFQASGLLQETEFVGLENYASVLADRVLPTTLGFTFSFVIVRLILVAIVPLLLAWAVSRFGRPVRLTVRVLLTFPLVLFIPVAIASVWSMLISPGPGGLSSSGFSPLTEPNAARLSLLLIDGLYTFGLACGLGLVFYLMVWRRPDESSPLPFRQVLKPLLATWGIGILATIALTMSSFTQSYVMTAGGPANSTLTLGLWQYRIAFQFFRFGQAATLAILILLLPLLSGLLAGLLVILMRLRLVHTAAAQPPQPSSDTPDGQPSKTLPLIMLVATLLLSLGACSLSALPFGWVMQQSFENAAYSELVNQVPIVRVLVNTVVPPLLAAIIQVLVAYLGALGIGALRPFGKHSEWLLLPFSPWLFVTLVPLSPVNFLSAREAGKLNTFVGLIPPLLLGVPLLFIMTLFFKGQASRWRATSTPDQSSKGAFLRQVMLPALPLAGGLLLSVFFIGLQGVVWPLIMATSVENYAMTTTLLFLRAQFASSGGLLAAAVTLSTLPIILFFFPVLVAFQLLYLDRLALRAGAEE